MTGVAAPRPWRATLGRRTGAVLFRILYRPDVHGGGHVPDGPAILAVNHTGYLDGAFVFAMSPRSAHFLVLQQTFSGFLGWLLRFVGQIPMDQRRGDRRALGAALTVLASGGVVGIFPEGGRGRGDLAEVGKGAAWLAMQSGAPVVPVACLGTRETGQLAAWWPPLRSRLVADFGVPIVVGGDPALPGRARLERASVALQERLIAHVLAASERHGIPLPTDVPPDLME